MKSYTAAFAAVASILAPQVLGHGYVTKARINGVDYTGYLPYSDPYTSPVPQRIFRKIPGNGPVEDLSLIDVQCNGWSAGGSQYAGSAPAALTATAPAGSTVTVYWTKWPDSHKGPLVTYMARCPGACSSYSPGNAAVWFKIHEAKYDSSGTNWASYPLEAADNVPFSFTIPSNLQAGNYIIRHEIFGLHAAWSYPGVQVYPSCFQVTVTGSGSAFPTSFVSFPGAYTASSPGIVFDMYTNGPAQYTIPGPPVWGGNTNGTPSNPPPASSTTRTSSSSRPPSSSSTSTSRPPSSSSRPSSSSSSSRTSSSGGTGAPLYGQCGGNGWAGPFTCAQGTCTKLNDFYSQCVP